jgi:hypothetical protein
MKGNIKGTQTVEDYCCSRATYYTSYYQLGVRCSMIDLNSSKSFVTMDKAFQKILNPAGVP